MGTNFKRSNPNLWLGTPLTAKNVVPATAGLLAPAVGNAIRLDLSLIDVQYRGTGTAGIALVGLLPDSMWDAATVAAGGNGVDDTTDAQDVDTDDFPLETTTNNSGFLIGADVPFGAVSIDVSTASIDGVSVARTLNYWNGTSFAAITSAQVLLHTGAALNYALGEALILFDPPADWAKGGTSPNVVNTARYNLFVKSTDAPTTAGLAKRVYVGEVLWSKDAAIANEVNSLSLIEPLRLPPYLTGVNGAFAVADAGNCIHLAYHFRG